MRLFKDIRPLAQAASPYARLPYKPYKMKETRHVRPVSFCVPKVGVEPTLRFQNYALNVARLPIPPFRLNSTKFNIQRRAVNGRSVENLPIRSCYTTGARR